jgi:predicted RNase H-like HicB family nuclease
MRPSPGLHSPAKIRGVELVIDLDREEDGRWLAEVVNLPGVMAYGLDREEALRDVEILALRVLTDRLESGEWDGGDIRLNVRDAA